MTIANGRAMRLSLACATLLFTACVRTQAPQVIAYIALDEMYARPILDDFERQIGIRVLTVYDTEASKTTGLVQRILAERDRPRADVFWNNEVVQTIVLKNAGALVPYASPAATDIPDRFKDADHFWAGFAARARVIIYNTGMVTGPPRDLVDLLDPKWKGNVAIANPLFGTTATHAAALFALWGDDKARKFFDDLKANDVAILAGNAAVRDAVGRGEYAVGLTDTDDANGGVEDGLPVRWLIAGADSGALVVPNSVAIVKGAPHPEEAKRFVDFLLSPRVEESLARSRSIQVPVRPVDNLPEAVPNISELTLMPINFAAAAAAMESSASYIRSHFQP